ncbi:hypothetical protein PIB30_076848 [Stylosanthes scabra]|uniref:CCHC-type domain-containing protein n=1 Tax=Stylosanthes scabra TaxID=79078 RepID=A0ABU6RQ87_9FABA|nr:hypothetical protein [Stylosanthes scabra]
MGQTLNIEYEGLHLICFGCGKYGHRVEYCFDRPASPESQPENAPINVEGKNGLRGNTNNKDYHPNWESNDTSNNENGSRFGALNNEDSDEEEIVHEDVNPNEELQPNFMQNGPKQTEAKKRPKTNPINHIQKKILKPGAGKNPQAHKKGQTKIDPSPSIMNQKGKNRVMQESPVAIVNTEGNKTQTSSSSSRSEDMILKEKEMLESLRRLKDDQVATLEASKLISNPLDSFIVKNSFLTQNPLFINLGEKSGESSLKMELVNVKTKPPDITMSDRVTQDGGSTQVSIGQRNYAFGAKPRSA